MSEPVNVEKLAADLMRDEGLRLKPYRDTVGKLTIGVGRNLDDVGITEAEALVLLQNDAQRARRDCRQAFDPWWDNMTERRKRALANMCFNLGLPRLMGFQKMLACLAAGDYDKAADEALDSQWATQVGDRAQRIATAFREG